MRILAFKHFEFDDTEALEVWAGRRDYRLTIHDPSAGVKKEWINETDLLVVLGGPMSVYEERRNPWLVEEKRFVEGMLAAERNVLGICLGAQMLADVLGAPVRRHDFKEVGWHEIRRTSNQHPWLADLPERFHSFQWHGDTFELPAGATLLAASEACERQAFAYGSHAVGLQFHLEATPACIGTMLERWSEELVDAPYIQQPARILDELDRSQASFHMLHGILDAAVGTPVG